MKIEITTMNLLTNPLRQKEKADCGIVLNGLFLIQGLKVLEGSRGLFVGWPSWREDIDPTSPRFPIFRILDDQERHDVEIQILEHYRLLVQTEQEARNPDLQQEE